MLDTPTKRKPRDRAAEWSHMGTVSVVLTPELRERVKVDARAELTSVTAVVRRIVKQHYDRADAAGAWVKTLPAGGLTAGRTPE